MASHGGADAARGDEIAAQIASYQGDAVRLARRLVRTQTEAEDLAQTAILNALRRANHIENPAHVKAYVLTTVRNLWRNQLRQQGRRRFVGTDAAELLETDDAGPEERALTALDAAAARLAFGVLSETSRRVLTLRYVDGLGFLELAAELGISPVAARQRAHRAREELICACIEQTAVPGRRTCGHVRTKLGRYLRGRLSKRVRSEISQHLSLCQACGECYEQLNELYGHRLTMERGQ
jgi:RNA polymerase sigma-70 factor (ECF subfamily)